MKRFAFILLVLIAVVITFILKEKGHEAINEDKGNSAKSISEERQVESKESKTTIESIELPEKSVSNSEPTSKEPIKSKDVEQVKSLVDAVTVSDPFETGKKERSSSLKLEDEFYLSEYQNEPFLAPFPKPKKLTKLGDHDLAWGWKLPKSVCGKPVVFEEHLYFCTYDTQVFKMELATGEIVGAKRVWYQPVGSPELSKDGILIIPQRNGNLTAFSLNDFSIVWNSRSAVFSPKKSIDLSIAGVTLVDNLIYVSKFWGSVYINKLSDGSLVSTPGVPYESRITTPVIPWNGGAIFTNVAGEIVFVKNDSDSQEWIWSLPSGYAISTTQYKGKLYILTSEKQLICLNLPNQEMVWQSTCSGYGFDSIKVYKDQLFVAAGDLYCFNLEGEEKWVSKSNQPWGYSRNFEIKNDLILVTEQEGSIRLFNLDGSQKMRWEMYEKLQFRNPTLLYKNMVIVSDISTKILAIEF